MNTMNNTTPNFLRDIIKKLYYDKDWNENSPQKYGDMFVQYYKEGNYNLYSPTYQIIADLDEDGSDILSFRLGEIEEYIKSKGNLDKTITEKFIKLKDYIVLESARAQTQSSLDKYAQKTLEQSVENLEKLKKLAEEHETNRKESSTQTITVLSIFTGIAMAFFGGFSLLGSAFNNLSNGLTAVVVLSSIIGFVLFNTVFCFLYMAGKISGKTVSVCVSDKCVTCPSVKQCATKNKEFPNVFIRTWKRYPYILLIDAVLIIVLTAFSFLYFNTDNSHSAEKSTKTEATLSSVAKASIYIGQGSQSEENRFPSEEIAEKDVLPVDQITQSSHKPVSENPPSVP